MAVNKIHLKCAQNERLDLFLREKLPEYISGGTDACSNSKIRRLIVAGAVSVNDRQIRIPSFTLRSSSEVLVIVDEDKFFYEKQPDDIKFELTSKDVLFEDDVLIVVNKPAFFPTEATIVGNRDNLHDAVVRYLWQNNPSLRNPPYVGIMHRLDRETSGVILFTKSRTVNGAVHDIFDSSNPEHSARKVYRAVCVAAECPSSFCVEMFMGRISAKSQSAKWGRLSEDRGGVFSHTDFIVKGSGAKNGKKVLYIEARPLTGRTHQIRVHLASKGLPILGDVLYGADKSERIMLHAQSLTFKHPISGKIMTVESVLPPYFK